MTIEIMNPSATLNIDVQDYFFRLEEISGVAMMEKFGLKTENIDDNFGQSPD